jgi:hypothetical protein
VPARRTVPRSGKVLKARIDNPQAHLSAVLAGVAMHTIGRPLLYGDDDLQRILSPRHFVNVRMTLGGPAPQETTRAIAELKQAFAAHAEWARERREHLAAAEARLRTRSAAL